MISEAIDEARLFPALAGMNRMTRNWISFVPAVPRARGDEPLRSLAEIEGRVCSPRSRG